MKDQEAYQRAKRRVEAKVGFFIHLSIYLAVSVLLVVLNLTSSPQYLWFKWPILGWGIGVLFHGLGVFVFAGRKVVTEQMIEKEMRRQAAKQRGA